MDIDLDKLMQSTRDQSQRGTASTSSMTEIEREVVRRFFKSIGALYGAGKCRATWPTDDEKQAAMRIWAPKIIRLGWQELNKRLEFAASNIHLDEFAWPNIGLILRGDAQPEQSGTAALSYRPASDVMALPRPSGDRKAGQGALDALRADMDAEADNRRQQAVRRFEEGRAELRRLEDKHLPAGYYVNTRAAEDGGIDCMPISEPHPFSSISKGRHFLT